MPWTETVPMHERRKFVEAYRSRTWSMSELCDRFSVSRKTGYKWLRRAEAGGWTGLEDRSRRPHCCPWQTPRQVEVAIVKARVRHPSWGAGKILEYLARRQPHLALPAPGIDHDDVVTQSREQPHQPRCRSAALDDDSRLGMPLETASEGRLRRGHPLSPHDLAARPYLTQLAGPRMDVDATMSHGRSPFAAYAAVWSQPRG